MPKILFRPCFPRPIVIKTLSGSKRSPGKEKFLIKKLFALMLALIALFSFAVAETAAETVALNWKDAEALIDTSLGEFVQIGSQPFAIWSPDPIEWEAAPAEDNMLEGYILTGEDSDGTPFQIAIGVMDATVFTRERVDAYIQPIETVTGYEKNLVNGMDAVSYTDETEAGPKGYVVIWANNSVVIMMTAAPFASDSIKLLFSVMAMSVQPIE